MREKKSRFLKAAVLLSVLLCMLFVLTACGKETSETAEASVNGKSEYVVIKPGNGFLGGTQTVYKETEPVSTGETNYILNTNTGKFHYPDCESVELMNEEHIVEFTGTRDEAIAQGYVPCQNCNP